MTITTVSGDEFVDALRPLADLLDLLVTTSRQSAGLGTAAADSIATDEISRQRTFETQIIDRPADMAHTHANLFRSVADDAVTQYAGMLRQIPLPLFAHTGVSRMGIEAAGWAAWLATTSIDLEARIKRIVAVLLRDLVSQSKGGVTPAVRGGAKVHKDQLRSYGHERGWTVIANSDQVKVGGELCPSKGQIVRDLLDSRQEQGSQLGKVAWYALSGFAHSNVLSLMSAIDQGPASPVTESHPLVINYDSVVTHSFVLAHGYIVMMSRMLELFGWTATAWDEALVEFSRCVVEFNTTGRVLPANST